ncbi:MAG TPA: helix-turn-helix transcriptional regulator [Bacilli bacterium]|nr:helix-turn-helix transcriptional regulator [Bacilli bacterium]
MNEEEVLQNLILEFRRGTLSLSVLSVLQKEKYGYALLQELEEKSLQIDQSTLYPLLRRLESQGLLESDWKLEDAKQRKYYKLTEDGKRVYEKLKSHWLAMVQVVDNILKEG